MKRLDLIEKRLNQLEQDYRVFKSEKVGKSKIKNEDELLTIVNQKVQELSQKTLGIQKVHLKDLFEIISRDFNISKQKFSDYLIKLYNKNKIQLEAGLSRDRFSIKDNYGNIFKLIRVFD
jgi:hypothetical protein